MKQIDVYVTNDDGEELHYKCQVAETEEDRKKGLQGVTDLPIDEGMLFVFDKETEQTFWMKNTPIPLAICFISEDMEILEVYDGVPNSEEPITDIAKYVLEVNASEPVSPGDDVDFDLDDTKYEFGKDMYVLNKDGKAQMTLEGGERIVSRKQTKVLIRKAKMCNRWKNRSKKRYDKYCADLGRYMFSVLEKQDTQEQEYVETPK